MIIINGKRRRKVKQWSLALTDPDAYTARNAKIIADHAAGCTYASIAREVGLGPDRVAVIVATCKRKQQMQEGREVIV
jgi:hypothetical protein